MKLASQLAAYPAARPLNADQVVEYHAARILLLLMLCGAKGQIHGLTKLAKLDFLVRYPAFFERAARELNVAAVAGTDLHDSTMVRHHYGPWDPRYYQVLAYLEARGLIAVTRNKRAFVFALTEAGSHVAAQLAGAPAFSALVRHMKTVKSVFGARSGDWLKKFVYRIFDEEVAKLSRGDVIR